MTTVQQSQTAWDAFVPNAAVKAHIDAFRLQEWDSIRRELLTLYHIALPDGLEPQWVGSGRAVYWHHEITTTREEVTDEDTGKVSWVRGEADNGWQPSGLPNGHEANNAGQIAHYLEKGFRLRPPVDGVDVEVFGVTAMPPEAQGEPEDTRPEYICERHPRGRLVFRTWDGYIEHCILFKEQTELMAPEEVWERMKKFHWFCFQHNKGFDNNRHLKHHRRQYPGHITEDLMLVSKMVGNADGKSRTDASTST